MNIVKRKSLKSIPENSSKGEGVLVKEALKLISKSKYRDEIYSTFKIEDIENEFIEIKGARSLVEGLIDSDEECLKIDIDSELNNVNLHKFTDESEIVLELLNIENKDLFLKFNKDYVLGESIYSVKSDYLNEMFHAEKYLDFCKSKKYEDIIDVNIKMLNEKSKQDKRKKKFRLLIDNQDKIYIRGITSVESYKDYNLRMSLFIALIELHKLIKYNSHSYYVDGYSYTESNLKVTFKSNQFRSVSDDIKLGFALELVNDEIRREAVKFNGVFTIFMGDAEVYINPETRSSIASFSHSTNIDTFKEKLNELHERLDQFIEDTVEDAKKIKILSRPDLFREHLQFKIQNSKNSDFNLLYRDNVKKLLTGKVNTIFELAEIFKRIDLLIEDDHVSSLDFWRYKLYQVLVESAAN